MARQFIITYIDNLMEGKQIYNCIAENEIEARNLWAEECPGQEILEVVDPSSRQESLQTRYGDWQSESAAGDTGLGYWEWVIVQLDNEEST